jgi:hypothetical protein
MKQNFKMGGFSTPPRHILFIIICMTLFCTTFWIGCKKDDPAIFGATENLIPFKGKAMTIEAAKTHYQKTQQALGLNLRTNGGDIDWANAVIDTAANGQVEVVAPVKDWAYSGTDGIKWAINSKFEYDANGNPQGNYVIVTHDIGNISDEYSSFSGHIWFFGMDKVFQEGYKYDNGMPTLITPSGDSINPDAGALVITTLADGCVSVCYNVEMVKTSGGSSSNQSAKGGTSPNIIADSDPYCQVFCRNLGGSGGGGSGGGGFSGGTGGGGGGSGSGGIPPTYNGTPATLYEHELLACRAFLARFPCYQSEQQIYNVVKPLVLAHSNYAGFTTNAINETLIRNVLISHYNLSTTQVTYLLANPGVTGQMMRARFLLGAPYAPQQMKDCAMAHLEKCRTDAFYAYQNGPWVKNFPMYIARLGGIYNFRFRILTENGKHKL